ncbi:MAG: HAMP domain-containing histidine kinase [Bdellovibrionaceae bacterium]|nr:HAMP domain-containing histidine kinase [Pseudobdellovibrionaceae bacterium]
MKNKIIWFFLVFFLSVVLIVTGIQSYFYYKAQLEALDNQLETAATLLLRSDLNAEDLEDFDRAQDTIEQVLGGAPLPLSIRVYNQDKKLLYSAGVHWQGAARLKLGWSSFALEEPPGANLRSLVLELPKGKGTKPTRRFLQIGAISYRGNWFYEYMEEWLFPIAGVSLIGILATNYLFFRLILRPLRDLQSTIKDMRFFIGRPGWESFLSEPRFRHLMVTAPELSEVINELRMLFQNMNFYLGNIKLWMSSLAHELKTPLSLIDQWGQRIEAARVLDEAKADAVFIRQEVKYLKDLVSAFLRWVEAAQTMTKNQERFVIDVREVLAELADRYKPQGLVVHADQDQQQSIKIVAHPVFFRQMLLNLIDNAFKYSASPLEQPPVLLLHPKGLKIINYGPSIPKEVIDHIGAPFNYGDHPKRGFGLGLAWVKLITDFYHMRLSLQSSLSRPDWIIFPSNKYRDENLSLYDGNQKLSDAEENDPEGNRWITVEVDWVEVELV